MSQVGGGLTPKTRKIRHQQVVHPPKIPKSVGVGSYGRRPSPGVSPAMVAHGSYAAPSRSSVSTGPSKAQKRVKRQDRRRVQAVKGIKQVRSKLKTAASKTTQIEGPLTSGQKTFAKSFSKAAGVSPRFAAAAVLREGGSNTPGDNNWLNIGRTDSGAASITGDPGWRAPKSAGKLTGKWIKGKFGKQYGYVASPGIQAITKAKGDQAQGQAWAGSGWASSGASPLDTLNQVSAKHKPIPKKLKHKAVRLLGKKQTKKVIKKAVSGGTPTSTTQLPGPWEGSRKAVGKALKGIIPAGGGKRTPAENAAVGGSPTSDHLTSNKNTYAKDISTSGAAGDKVFSQVAKNLGVKATPGTYNWYTSDKAPGYRFQILWQVEGHFDHVHVGAEYQGASATSTSGATSGATGTTGVSAAGAVPTTAGPGVDSKGTTSRRGDSKAREIARKRKMAARAIGGYRQSLKPVVVKPTAKVKSTTPSTTKIKLGL